jgi:hypothetical protein
VLAFDTVDDAAPDVLGVYHVRAQDLVRVREKEIGSGQVDSEIPPDLLDKLIDRSGRFGLGEELVFVVRHHERFAVEEQFDVSVAPGPTGVELVRTVQLQLARTIELDFL